MFNKKGVIAIEREGLDEDTVMSDALEAGAADFAADEDVFEITTEPDDFSGVREDLEKKGYEFVSADVEMVPDTYTTITDEDTIVKMQKMLDLLEDNDDVQNVWHNWDAPEEEDEEKALGLPALPAGRRGRCSRRPFYGNIQRRFWKGRNLMRHLIDPLDFSRQETDRLLSLAEEIIARPGDYAHLCDGKILATLFYEPSTRTRLSFERHDAPGGQGAGVLLGGQQLRRQGRERCRHHPHDLRLRGHCRHAPL